MNYSIQSVGPLFTQIPVVASRQLINIYNYLPTISPSECIYTLINRKVSVLEIAKLLKTPAKIALFTLSIVVTGTTIYFLTILYSDISNEKYRNELKLCIKNNDPEKAHKLLTLNHIPTRIISNIFPTLGLWAVKNDHQTVLEDLLNLAHPGQPLQAANLPFCLQQSTCADLLCVS
ncbi:MAG: hypothetical protein ChlgKO_11960 [Chlamydiales bacterium]